jgi:hypothetical protein
MSGSEFLRQEFFEIQAVLVEQIFLLNINVVYGSRVKPILSFQCAECGLFNEAYSN